jgi:hypothetical protein
MSLQSNKDYVAPHAAGVTFAMGIAAIWPTLYSYGISILPVSRTSSLLACIGLSYEVSYYFMVTAFMQTLRSIYSSHHQALQHAALYQCIVSNLV